MPTLKNAIRTNEVIADVNEEDEIEIPEEEMVDNYQEVIKLEQADVNAFRKYNLIRTTQEKLR